MDNAPTAKMRAPLHVPVFCFEFEKGWPKRDYIARTVVTRGWVDTSKKNSEKEPQYWYFKKKQNDELCTLLYTF